MVVGTRRSSRRIAERAKAADTESAGPASATAPSQPSGGGPVATIRKAVRKATGRGRRAAAAAVAAVSPKPKPKVGRPRAAKSAAKDVISPSSAPASTPASASASASAPASASASTPAKPSTSKKSADKNHFPSAKLYDDEGVLRNTEDIVSESACIFFLYPKANTPGCTKQACGFKAGIAEIQKAGYNVYGLSYDSVKSQHNWKNKHSLPYSLLCDTPDAGLIKKLGAHKDPKSVKRSHFVVEKGGKIIVRSVQITPTESISTALEYVRSNPLKDAAVDMDVDASMQDADAKEPAQNGDVGAQEHPKEKPEAPEEPAPEPMQVDEKPEAPKPNSEAPKEAKKKTADVKQTKSSEKGQDQAAEAKEDAPAPMDTAEGDTKHEEPKVAAKETTEAEADKSNAAPEQVKEKQPEAKVDPEKKDASGNAEQPQKTDAPAKDDPPAPGATAVGNATEEAEEPQQKDVAEEKEADPSAKAADAESSKVEEAASKEAKSAAGDAKMVVEGAKEVASVEKSTEAPPVVE